MSEQKRIVVKGKIADGTGHTDFEGTAEEAVALAVDQSKNFSKWLFVKNETGEMKPFFFNGHDKPEEDRFKTQLLANDEPEFRVTGALAGGHI